MKHSRSCSTISHTIYPLIIDNEHTKLYPTITFPPKTHKRISPVHPQRPPFSLPWDSWILGRKDIGRYRLGESHDVLSHLREKPTIDQVNCRDISFHERREEHWRLRGCGCHELLVRCQVGDLDKTSNVRKLRKWFWLNDSFS